jgi:hypothetical protein
MARYMTVAADAGRQIEKIIGLVDNLTDLTPEDIKVLAKEMGYLYNLGIRTAPRAVQGTVRKNAVAEALKSYDIHVGMTSVVDEKTGYSYNKLVLS